jgi:hypothetical protein
MCFGTLTTLWCWHIANCYRRFEETYCWPYSESRTVASPWRWMKHFLRRYGNCREYLYRLLSLEISSESGRRRYCIMNDEAAPLQSPVRRQNIPSGLSIWHCVNFQNNWIFKADRVTLVVVCETTVRSVCPNAGQEVYFPYKFSAQTFDSSHPYERYDTDIPYTNGFLCVVGLQGCYQNTVVGNTCTTLTYLLHGAESFLRS